MFLASQVHIFGRHSLAVFIKPVCPTILCDGRTDRPPTCQGLSKVSSVLMVRNDLLALER